MIRLENFTQKPQEALGSVSNLAQEKIAFALARKILAGEVKSDNKVKVDIEGGELVFK